METTENQGVATYRDQLVERMRSRYPDRNFDSPNSPDSPDGLESPDSLEQSIVETLAENDRRLGELDELESKTNALSELLNNSVRASVFLNTLASTGDPSAAIYRAYGKEAHDAFVQGDASELIASIEADDQRRRSEDEAFEAEKAANLQASFDALDQWGDSKGLDEDQKVAVFMRFYNILSDALVGKYSPELFEMGWKADNYDTDVENARREGEVAGRNANIRAQTRRRQASAAMPPALSGQGVRQSEPRPAAAADDNPWML